jgi:hypothetical protein
MIASFAAAAAPHTRRHNQKEKTDKDILMEKKKETVLIGK